MLHFEKVLNPILKIDGEQDRPTHYLGNILGHLATKNVITLDDTMMQQYSQNEEFIDPSLPERTKWMSPYYIVKRKDYGMSVTKRVPDGRKNKWGK